MAAGFGFATREVIFYLVAAGSVWRLVAALLALVVLGPKDLPVLLRRLGKATARVRGMANEFRASFDEMAREHSIADTRERGGLIGKVLRGSLRSDVEARVFNAAAGDLLGPFTSGDRTTFEIFRVNAKNPAHLDDDTATEVRRLLREEWLRARAREHVIEAG